MDPEHERVAYLAWDTYYQVLETKLGVSGGRKDFWQHRLQKAFYKIAEICLIHRFDVEDYVTRCFDVFTDDIRYILPSALTSPDIQRAYRRHLDAYADLAELNWKLQISLLLSMECRFIPKKYSTEIEILKDLTIALEPWFRLLYPDTIDEKLFKFFGTHVWNMLAQNRKLYLFLRRQRPGNIHVLEQRLGTLHHHILEGAPA